MEMKSFEEKVDKLTTLIFKWLNKFFPRGAFFTVLPEQSAILAFPKEGSVRDEKKLIIDIGEPNPAPIFRKVAEVIEFFQNL